MPIGAVIGAAGIGAAGSLASSSIQSNAATTAANDQTQAAQIAANTQLSMYNTTAANLAPYLSTGTSAVNQLASLFGLGGANGAGAGVPNASAAMSALTNFPGYQFGLQQGGQALDRSAASQGLLLSGAQLKDAQQFGTNYAQSAAWSPYISQLNTLGSLGESAGSQTGNAATAAGTGIASSQLAAGASQASGVVGSANATTAGLTSALQNGSLSYLLSQQGNQTSPSYVSPLDGGTPLYSI